jgi:hypothetical protein
MAKNRTPKKNETAANLGFEVKLWQARNNMGVTA